MEGVLVGAIVLAAAAFVVYRLMARPKCACGCASGRARARNACGLADKAACSREHNN